MKQLGQIFDIEVHVVGKQVACFVLITVNPVPTIGVGGGGTPASSWCCASWQWHSVWHRRGHCLLLAQPPLLHHVDTDRSHSDDCASNLHPASDDNGGKNELGLQYLMPRGAAHRHRDSGGVQLPGGMLDRRICAHRPGSRWRQHKPVPGAPGGKLGAPVGAVDGQGQGQEHRTAVENRR